MPAGRPLLVEAQPQHQRRPEMDCHLWRPKCGAGAVAPRDSWAMEISLPGMNRQMHVLTECKYLVLRMVVRGKRECAHAQFFIIYTSIDLTSPFKIHILK